MSFHSGSSARRVLIGCTALSLLGVASVFVDYGLARGALWAEDRSSLRQEFSQALLAFAFGKPEPAAALAIPLEPAPQAAPMPELAAPARSHRPPLLPHASETAAEEPIYAASLTPAPALEADRLLPEPGGRGAAGDESGGDEPSPGETAPLGSDDDPAAPPASAELALPQPEPLAKGASAALFLLSSSMVSPASAPEAPAVEAKPAPSVTASIVQPAGASLPSRNPFVASASLAARAAAPVAPAQPSYGWSELVRMASMKGGDGEEEPRIFGGLTEKEFRARELRCMATAIYFEARGESLRGQIAVGQVIMTRVRSNFYPNTICGVVFQGQWNKNSCQFSFACDGETDMPKEREQWATALDVAKKVIAGKVYLDDIADATHYHAVYVRPDWRRQMRRVKQLGVHIFYKAPYVLPLAELADHQPL